MRSSRWPPRTRTASGCRRRSCLRSTAPVGLPTRSRRTRRRVRRRSTTSSGLEPGPRAARAADRDPPPGPEPLGRTSRAARPPTLPAPATALVGAHAEIAAVVDLLTTRDVRLVTLTGPGGIGKTRIALQAAHELAAEFADGVWFVGLAPLTAADLVPSTIARALGVDEGPAAPCRRWLIICARVGSCSSATTSSTSTPRRRRSASCSPPLPGLTILVTSRVALRLYGEHVRAVPVLDLEDEAVPLFRGPSRSARRSTARAPGNRHRGERPAIATICERLDRLPLAIELVAARADELPLGRSCWPRSSSRLDVATAGRVTCRSGSRRCGPRSTGASSC